MQNNTKFPRSPRDSRNSLDHRPAHGSAIHLGVTSVGESRATFCLILALSSDRRFLSRVVNFYW